MSPLSTNSKRWTVSVASVLMTTDCLITEIPKKETASAAGHDDYDGDF